MFIAQKEQKNGRIRGVGGGQGGAVELRMEGGGGTWKVGTMP
jgi:hypothetical protein